MAYRFPRHPPRADVQPFGFAGGPAFQKPYERRLVDWAEAATAILQYGNGIVHVPPGGVILPLERIMQPGITRILQVLPIIRAIFYQQATEIIGRIVALVRKFSGSYAKLALVLLVEPTHILRAAIYVIRRRNTRLERRQPIGCVEA